MARHNVNGQALAEALNGRLRYARRSAASVGQWLTATGAAPSAYRVSQGARVGRAATIEITADTDGTVWVGGATIACIRGTITF